MDKYTWFIFVWNTPESGYYCHAWKVKNGDNLPAVIRDLMQTGGELVTMCANMTVDRRGKHSDCIR